MRDSRKHKSSPTEHVAVKFDDSDRSLMGDVHLGFRAVEPDFSEILFLSDAHKVADSNQEYGPRYMMLRTRIREITRACTMAVLSTEISDDERRSLHLRPTADDASHLKYFAAWAANYDNTTMLRLHQNTFDAFKITTESNIDKELLARIKSVECLGMFIKRRPTGVSPGGLHVVPD